MKILPDHDLKAVCSVTALAEKLHLSRVRFYQLQKLGVFPMPVYCIRTKRPLYPLDLQQMCIHIRETGIGLNGQLVLFHTPRKIRSPRVRNQVEPQHKKLSDILKQMGLSVSSHEVKNAVKVLYKGGLAKGPIEEAIIVDLYKYLIQAQ